MNIFMFLFFHQGEMAPRTAGLHSSKAPGKQNVSLNNNKFLVPVFTWILAESGDLYSLLFSPVPQPI